jgi:hypothetical protein
VSKNMMEMRWFLHLQMVITHISLPNPTLKASVLHANTTKAFRRCNERKMALLEDKEQ